MKSMPKTIILISYHKMSINSSTLNVHKFKYFVDIFWHNRLSENIIIRFGQIRRLMQKNNGY